MLVHTDDGVTGVASGGDGLPDRELLERLLAGVDVRDTDAVGEICETVDFHGARPWAVEVAVWDALGKLLDAPVSSLLGGRNDRLRAYASTGEAVTPAGAGRAVRRARRARDRRGQAPPPRRALAGGRRRRRGGARGRRRRARADGRREPGLADARRPHAALGRRHRRGVRAELEALGVYWLEEPLPAEDPEAYAALRERDGDPHRGGGDAAARRRGRATSSCAASSTSCRRMSSSSAGFGGCRQIAALAEAHGRAWSPHTWSNGVGLVANLHGGARLLDGAVDRGAVRPAGVEPASGATGCSSTPLEIAAGRHDPSPGRAGPRDRARPRPARALAHRLMVTQ